MQDGDLTTARERASNCDWLESGGFYPPDYSLNEVRSYLDDVFRRTAQLVQAKGGD